MRIVHSDVWQVSTEAANPSRNRYGGVRTIERVLIRVRGEEGSEGWGESLPLPHFSGETAEVAARHVRGGLERLKGRPLEVPSAAIDEAADFSGQPAARAGLETALLDWEGNASGKPLTDWLGGQRRDEVSGDGPIGLLPPGQAAERARAYLGRGIATMKVKVGVGPDADAARVRRIRAELGDAVRIRVDANGGYSREEALRFCQLTEDVGLEHFEQPVMAVDEGGLDTFREIRAMGIPVAVDESLRSLDDARRLVDSGAADIAMIKIIKFGGPLRARRVAETFEEAGKLALVTSPYETYIAKAAALALAVSLERCDRAHEINHFVEEEPFTEWRHEARGARMRIHPGPGHGACGIMSFFDALPSPD